MATRLTTASKADILDLHLLPPTNQVVHRLLRTIHHQLLSHTLTQAKAALLRNHMAVQSILMVNLQLNNNNHPTTLNKHLPISNSQPMEVNNHHTAESNINRVTAQDIPLHNLNNILLLPATSKVVLDMAQLQILSLATMLRCLAVSMELEDRVPMYRMEVIRTMDSNTRASSLQDHHQPRAEDILAEDILEQDIKANRDDGNMIS